MYTNSLQGLRSLYDSIVSGDDQKERKRKLKALGERERARFQESMPEEPTTGVFNTVAARFMEIREENERLKEEPIGPRGEGNTSDALYEVEEKPRGSGIGARPKRFKDASGADIGYQLKEDLQKELGISEEAAAGIVGNLHHETGGFEFMQEIEPLVEGSKGGYGFAQWTGPRRKQFMAWSKEKGLDPSSYEANKGFLIHELTQTSEGKVMNKLKDVNDPTEAARIFSDTFLRPGIPNMDSRLTYAQAYMKGA